jgi:hypothetical protein
VSENLIYLVGLAVIMLLATILLFAIGDTLAGLVGLGVTSFLALLVFLEARGRHN